MAAALHDLDQRCVYRDPIHSPSEQRWFAVNTHSASEVKACWHLESQGWQTFFPKIERTLRSGRRIRTEMRPYFPGYIFMRLSLASDPWRAVDSTIGVRRLVKNGDQPAALPRGLVEGLQTMASGSGKIDFTSRLQPGGQVKFLTGPFAEMIGALEQLDSKGRVMVLLNLLGRQTHVMGRAAELQPL